MCHALGTKVPVSSGTPLAPESGDARDAAGKHRRRLFPDLVFAFGIEAERRLAILIGKWTGMCSFASKSGYRWHPCFGWKVRIRQVEERADGRYVRAQDPAGVLMANWMLDPLACAAMTVGPPRVDFATLIEPDKLPIEARLNKVSSEETANV